MAEKEPLELVDFAWRVQALDALVAMGSRVVAVRVESVALTARCELDRLAQRGARRSS